MDPGAAWDSSLAFLVLVQEPAYSLEEELEAWDPRVQPASWGETAAWSWVASSWVDSAEAAASAPADSCLVSASSSSLPASGSSASSSAVAAVASGSFLPAVACPDSLSLDLSWASSLPPSYPL